MRTAVFHGVEIPEALLAQEAQHHPHASAAQARRAAGDALATKALLLARAEALGLAPQPQADEDGCVETEESALIRAVLEAEVTAREPTEAECRRVYDAHRPRTPSGAAPFSEEAHAAIRAHLRRRAWDGAAARYVLDLAEAASAQGVAISLANDGAVAGGAGFLGELLAAPPERLAAWLASADPGLAARVDAAAGREGLAVGDFLSGATREFFNHGDDEAWTKVASAARDADDPALGALAAMLAMRLRPPPAPPQAAPPRTFTVIGRRQSK